MASRWIARASAGLCLVTACTSVDVRVTCPELDVGASILRSRAELVTQLAQRRDGAVEGGAGTSCTPEQFGDVDWDTQAVAVLRQDGSSNVERMTVRGDRLKVLKRQVRQCGGQEVFSWQGTTLVVVPVEVRAVEIESLPAKPCPSRHGPARP